MSDSNQQANTFTCCLIGGDSLLSQCGDILLEGGHSIERVISDALPIVAWAKSKGIPTTSVSGDYTTELKQTTFDYLFAITHLALIPEAAVATPRKGAINFHDGPLPDYAGLNTPMWALINGANAYGITWHTMAAGIDTGDILIREPVSISDDDTAVSLNTKCFTAALDSFPRLLEQLTNNTLAPEAQDLSRRQYFGRADRPANLGLLDWSTPAEQIDRLVRGLNTGRYENALSTPKAILGDQVYCVSAGKIRDDHADVGAGTAIPAEGDLIVGTASSGYQISQLTTLAGEPVEIESVLNDALRSSPVVATELAAGVNKDESFWLKRLQLAEAITLPYRSASGKAESAQSAHKVEVAVPQALTDQATSFLASAVVAFLARITGSETLSVGLAGGRLTADAAAHPELLHCFGMDQFMAELSEPAKQSISQQAEQIEKVTGRSPWLKDLVARNPLLRNNPVLQANGHVPVLISLADELPEDVRAELVFHISAGDTISIEYLSGAYTVQGIEALQRDLSNWLVSLADQPDARGCELDLLSPADRQRLLEELNQTECDYDRAALMHSDFETLAATDPEAIAVIARGQSINYGALNAQADQLAIELQAKGVGPDDLVGVYVNRSIDLMVATLGILKSGAAYVPLDPAFPADRIDFMIEDSAMPIIICQSALRANLPESPAEVLEIDSMELSSNTEKPNTPAQADNLAYVIYTSGSTGKPKGVMLEHGNVVNFFTAMDRAVPEAQCENRAWLAVTSLSFDISVLELFWTLNRGFKVIIHDETSLRDDAPTASTPHKALDMGLFMWGNDDAPGSNKYRLLLEGSKFFDQNGFSAVWTPERHFHAFGGPYPNPAVTGAAVAAITKNVKIRAGSCVVPLHHPVRIAEEWGVVDNLSDGRVEIAAASGWNPNDFVLKPENHANNKQAMFDQLVQVQKLWRGEKLLMQGPLGEVEVQSLPRPVQAELPCWITTAGNPESWIQAGKLGHNVLTHLLGQSVEEVKEKVRLYRNARAESGHDPASGRVALMLHTYVGEDDSEVKELVREPMKEYLSSSMRLAMDYAWAFPTFKKPGGEDAKPEDIDLKGLSEEETDTILNFAFERYYQTSGLLGTEETCLQMLSRCADAGIDEIACLMDFGVETQAVLDSLPRLKALRDQMVSQVAAAAPAETEETNLSFAQLVERHGVTHLQCTPSTARMYLTDSDSRQALAKIPNLLLGGEALPINLAQEIKSINPGTLSNMYGPTETTIWSMTSTVQAADTEITIGAPIANTSVYVLDPYGNLVPEDIPGELYIGGEGVARGYLNRPDLTAERFVADPYASRANARMYATGDLAAYRPDGKLDYLGRTDFQVKVRGYRIELGEIEALLEAQAEVAEAAVIVRTAEDGDQRLVAYVVMAMAQEFDASALREKLRGALPSYMIPNEFMNLEYMPRTANGKLDRKALAEIKPVAARTAVEDTAPSNDLEKSIADIWCKVLKLEVVGLNENFFDIGGHSLLVVQLHKQLKEAVEQPVSLTDLYQYTTVRSLAEYLTGGADDTKVKQSMSRGEQRRALRRRRAS